MHAGNGIGDHGLVRVERHIARQRAVTPRTEVVALGRRGPRGGACEVELHLDVIGIGRPTVADELPVELGGIGPVHDRTGHGVAHIKDRAVAALVRAEHLDSHAVIGLLHGIDATIALVCTVDLVKRGVIFLDAQHVDAHRTALLVGACIDVPEHAVDIVVEIELTPLDNGQRTIGLDRGADIGLAHGVTVGVRGGGQQQQRKRDERADGSESREQATLPTGLGNGGVHRHILCL